MLASKAGYFCSRTVGCGACRQGIKKKEALTAAEGCKILFGASAMEIQNTDEDDSEGTGEGKYIAREWGKK